MQLSITICKVLLQLPIIINAESKQRQLLEDVKKDNGGEKKEEIVKNGGILNQNIESALKLAVGLLETGEKYTAW